MWVARMERAYWNIMRSRCALKVKSKFYQTTIRPALLYGSECKAFKKDHNRLKRVVEMQMLR